MAWNETVFNCLYPNYDKMEWEDKRKANYDRLFLKLLAGNEITPENLTNFADIINASTISHEEAMKVFNEIKLDKYFQTLYPDFVNMPETEQSKALRDKIIIGENIRKFEYFLTGTRYDLPEGEQITASRCEHALKNQKLIKYMKILHPDYREMDWSSKEYEEAVKDENFIADNIEAIDECFIGMQPNSSNEEMTEQEKYRAAIDKVKSDLEKNNEQGTSLDAKESKLSGLEVERKEKEAKVKAIENTQSPNQGE